MWNWNVIFLTVPPKGMWWFWHRWIHNIHSMSLYSIMQGTLPPTIDNIVIDCVYYSHFTPQIPWHLSCPPLLSGPSLSLQNLHIWVVFPDCSTKWIKTILALLDSSHHLHYKYRGGGGGSVSDRLGSRRVSLTVKSGQGFVGSSTPMGKERGPI